MHTVLNWLLTDRNSNLKKTVRFAEETDVIEIPAEGMSRPTPPREELGNRLAEYRLKNMSVKENVHFAEDVAVIGGERRSLWASPCNGPCCNSAPRGRSHAARYGSGMGIGVSTGKHIPAEGQRRSSARANSPVPPPSRDSNSIRRQARDRMPDIHHGAYVRSQPYTYEVRSADRPRSYRDDTDRPRLVRSQSQPIIGGHRGEFGADSEDPNPWHAVCTQTLRSDIDPATLGLDARTKVLKDTKTIKDRNESIQTQRPRTVEHYRNSRHNIDNGTQYATYYTFGLDGATPPPYIEASDVLQFDFAAWRREVQAEWEYIFANGCPSNPATDPTRCRQFPIGHGDPKETVRLAWKELYRDRGIDPRNRTGLLSRANLSRSPQLPPSHHETMAAAGSYFGSLFRDKKKKDKVGTAAAARTSPFLGPLPHPLRSNPYIPPPQTPPTPKQQAQNSKLDDPMSLDMDSELLKTASTVPGSA